MRAELVGRLKTLKLLILDCDGVLTDGDVYVDNLGNESCRFSHRDGMGIRMLRESGIPVLVITTQVSPYVQKRCDKMKIPCFYGVKDKLETLKNLLCRPADFTAFSSQEICFVGDDVGDIEIMKFVGFPIAVADAIEPVKKVAVYITKRKGGERAVREVCDLILKAKGIKV